MRQLGEYQGCVFVGRVIFAHKKMETLKISIFFDKDSVSCSRAG